MCTTCGCGNAEVRIDGKSIQEALEPRIGEDSPSLEPAVGEIYRYAHAPAAPFARVRAHGSTGHGGAEHWHRHEDGTYHRHDHDDEPSWRRTAHLADAESTAAGVGNSAARTIQVERDLLAKNDAIAAENRRTLAELGVFALNLVSSPGSGKTTLLVKTITAWQGRTPIAVIEGDHHRRADRRHPPQAESQKPQQRR